MQLAVTVFGAAHSHPIAAEIEEFSGDFLSLHLSDRLESGAVIRIEGSDMLLLGEVCMCGRKDGEWRAMVEVRHRLEHLSELRRLNRALFGEAFAGVEHDSRRFSRRR